MVGFSIHMGVKSIPFCACARKWGISMQVNTEKRYLLLRELLREKEEIKKGFHRERRDCVGITWEKSQVPMLSYVLWLLEKLHIGMVGSVVGENLNEGGSSF